MSPPATRGGAPRSRQGAVLAHGAFLVLVAAIVLHVIAARPEPIWGMEYRYWIDGEKYSMATWRYREDMKFAIGRYLDWTRGPLGPGGRQERETEPASVSAQTDLTEAYQEVVERHTRRAGIRQWQFWRTLPDRGFLRQRRPYIVPPLEDTGRSSLAAVGFVVLGGVAPYLILWLGVLMGLFALSWLWLELYWVGEAVAGLWLTGLLALSPFFVESLSLPHSAVGFYLAGLFVVSALAVWAALGQPRPERGYWPRVVLASLVLGVCALCRSATVALLPAALVAVVLAARRCGVRAGGRRIVALALLLAPQVAVASRERHPVWLGLWEGLADFARDRGYSWHDRDAKRFAAKHGLDPWAHPNEQLPSHEAFFRDEFLRDVGSDPAWYAGVLLRRTGATLTQSKLLPRASRDNRSVEEPIFHYKYVTPVDFLGVYGRRMFEIPLWWLWLPVPLLAGLALRQPRARRQLQIVGLMALAALAVPVLITTAGAIETQALAIGYFMAAGFAVGDLLRAVRPASPGPGASS